VIVLPLLSTALAGAPPDAPPDAPGLVASERPPWDHTDPNSAPSSPAATTTPNPWLSRDVGGFGAGIILGLPTGISLAFRPGGSFYWDGALAWSFSRGSAAVHFDALLQVTNLKSPDLPDIDFPLYIGVGPRVRIGDNTEEDSAFDLGVRVPVGMNMMHDNLPIEGFFEIAPGVKFYPGTTFLFDIAIGARLYFPG
jgi:hypothetical protein